MCYVRDKEPDADQDNAELLYLFSQKPGYQKSEVRKHKARAKLNVSVKSKPGIRITFQSDKG